ncbi:MAG: hypothetical protein JXP73_09435 [Deltaproteobacteria bacterium]|nr:hypothetical protein [Deltaproteobacteria bacterium]
MDRLDHALPRNHIRGIKAVGIRDLKLHLSSCLRDVARGDVIRATDRSRVVT